MEQPSRRARERVSPERPAAKHMSANECSRPPEATVFLVEDEDSFVEALTVGLKREGFRVQVANDGA